MNISPELFNICLDPRQKGRAVSAARMVLCFGLSQEEASKSFKVSHQATAKVCRTLKARVKNFEKAFELICGTVGLDINNEYHASALVKAIEVFRG